MYIEVVVVVEVVVITMMMIIIIHYCCCKIATEMTALCDTFSKFNELK